MGLKIFFERLGPGFAPIEMPLTLEELTTSIDEPLILGWLGWEKPPSGQGRIVMEGAEASGTGIGLIAKRGSPLAVALPVDDPAEGVRLAARRRSFFDFLTQTSRPKEIELGLVWYPEGQESRKPMRLRPRLHSDRPPVIKPDGPEVKAIDAEALGRSTEPVAFARLRLTSGEHGFAVERPKAVLLLRGDETAGRDGPSPSEGLYVRRIDEKTGRAETWRTLATLDPIPLPDDFIAFVFEFGLAVPHFVAWKRSRAPAGADSPIRIGLIVRPLGEGPSWQHERVEIRPEVQGRLSDILVLEHNSRQHRRQLASAGAGSPPVVHFPGVRTVSRQRRDSSDFEPSLEELEFQASVPSDDANWLLGGTAELFDAPDPGDASERASRDIEDVKLLAGKAATVRVALPALAAELIGRCRLDDAVLRLTLDLRRDDASDPHRAASAEPGPAGWTIEVRMAVSIAPAWPDWLVCIDFGASAIAIGVARSTQLHPVAVPLGDWFMSADPYHAEVKRMRGEVSNLLPSYVGLSSRLNLRSHVDPASLGDLRAVSRLDTAASGDHRGQQDKTVETRLDATGCTHDVSIPFPSSQTIADFKSEVVLNLKRELAGGQQTVSTSGPVWRKRSGVLELRHDIKIAELFEDCMSELGAFVMPRALQHALHSEVIAFNTPWRDFQAHLDAGQSDSSIGLVLTHPFGLEPRQIAVYREAGRRFLAGLLGLPHDEPVPGSIMPIPEALAAARYGIAELRKEGKLPPGNRVRIVCLDIGASTYDVTIIDAQPNPSPLQGIALNWDICGHFGVLVGGRDLDYALARRVIGILAESALITRVTDLFQVETRLAASYDEISTNRTLRRKQWAFLKALQQAKSTLTTECFDAKGVYGWNGTRLAIDVGTISRPSTENDDLPLACLRPEDFPQAANAIQTIAIGDSGAELHFGRKETVPFVHLIVPEQALGKKAGAAGGEARGKADLGALTELLSLRVPQLAARIAAENPGASDGSPISSTWWIVTGRTALWPTIYDGIAKTAAERNGQIRDRPFPPADMKRAVQEGALRLAIDRQLPLATNMLPAIAVVPHSHVATDSPIRLLVENEPTDITTPGRHSLVRLIPGLNLFTSTEREEMGKFFTDVEIPPWQELRELPRQGLKSVKLFRQQGGLYVAAVFEDGRQVPPYGPYREDRIYGHDDLRP